MIGRQKEVSELNNLYYGNKAEFIAIYGRRRVGKTYLIDEVFTDRFTFRHAGLSPIEKGNTKSPLKVQLQYFYYSLLQQGMKKSHQPKDWMEAFTASTAGSLILGFFLYGVNSLGTLYLISMSFI